MTVVRRAMVAAALVAVAGAGSACSRFVILHDPLSAEEHNDLGVAYESAGRLDLAKREYRRALRLDGGLTVARINLGNVEAARGRWSAAEDHYRRALLQAPENPRALNNLAWVLFRQDRELDEAEALARRALSAAGAADTTYARTLEAIVEARARRR